MRISRRALLSGSANEVMLVSTAEIYPAALNTRPHKKLLMIFKSHIQVITGVFFFTVAPTKSTIILRVIFNFCLLLKLKVLNVAENFQ